MVHSLILWHHSGLRFLKEYTPALDSLNPESPLPKFLSPNAVFIMNGATPTPFAEVEKMFQMRSQMLKDFHHDVIRAWDIEASDGKNGARTVMVDWTSTTILKQDAEGKPIKISEFGVIHLGPCDASSGGFQGLWAIKLETWMDTSPVRNRMAEVMAAKQES
jgi:hypothetical protein